MAQPIVSDPAIIKKQISELKVTKNSVFLFNFTLSVDLRWSVGINKVRANGKVAERVAGRLIFHIPLFFPPYLQRKLNEGAT